MSNNKLILHRIIDNHCTDNSNNIAIEEKDRKVSYGELKVMTDKVASTLSALAIEKGDVVGVFLDSSIEYVAAILGVNKAGAVFMPLEVKYPPARLKDLLQTVAPRYVITDQSHKSCLDNLLADAAVPPRLLLMEDTAAVLASPVFPDNDVELTGEDGNYLIYTSGSTGKPKVIAGMHKSLSHFVHWEVKEFGLKDSVRCCQLAPLSFDVSFRDIFVPLLAGGTLCIPPADVKKDPAQLLAWICEAGITLMHTVPSLFRVFTGILAKAPVKGTLPAYILLAGEALYYRDVVNWRNVAGDSSVLVNLYGPSETTLAKVFHRIGHIEEDSNEIIPLGQAISNTSVLVLQDGQSCRPGAIGEIYIRTPFRSKGYFKDEAQTNERFIQHPGHNEYEDILYKTGDLGKIQKDGLLVFVGREDRQVKIRGNRVELFEIEKHLQRFPGIREVLVMPHTDKSREISLILYYTAATAIPDITLRNHLQENLPDYMVPAFFLHLETFPLMLNGKIDRRALPRPEALLYQHRVYEPPVDEEERRIEAIWSEVLGLEKVGRDYSFFDLGGHSIAAFKIVSALCREFDTTLSLSDFFEHPKISELALLIKQAVKKEILT
ncbi:non-ribosomal peptide synthetase [Chitinophaga sp. 22536]|uniref:non-ribosomal peptide synthetase n=1 Tax=unclassified Chitinophaga TaxID=2619133 RepID=UPI003F86E7B0